MAVYAVIIYGAYLRNLFSDVQSVFDAYQLKSYINEAELFNGLVILFYICG